MITAPLKNKLYLSPPFMCGKEREFIDEAFNTNWIAPLGPNVDGFEKDLQDYLGVKSAAALSSGTAAIHLGLILLGVGAGDSVLCSSFTFAASANPITYQGAVPVFVGSESDTWNICPNALEEAIVKETKNGRKPKALVLVDLYGIPAKMDEVLQVCTRHDVAVLEDAAEGLGSAYKGKKLGNFGALAALSFNGNKIITTSGGGALVSNNPEYANKARFLATQARDPAPHYQHSQIGHNYRMSNIIAGIGRGQMTALDARIQRRREVFEQYSKLLSSNDRIEFLAEPTNCFCNRWLTTIVFHGKKPGENRDVVMNKLAELNIESRPLWKPLHKQPVFSECKYYGNDLAERLFASGLCLPSGAQMSSTEVEMVSELVMHYSGIKPS
jgi:dTDP-4-amino-4,6-dideoxygalactose transaminase